MMICKCWTDFKSGFALLTCSLPYPRWKAKVKQLERDLDRSKHGAAQVIQRNEQLVKEMEQQKHHGGYAQMQLDGMKRELQDALVSML